MMADLDLVMRGEFIYGSLGDHLHLCQRRWLRPRLGPGQGAGNAVPSREKPAHCVAQAVRRRPRFRDLGAVTGWSACSRSIAAITLRQWRPPSGVEDLESESHKDQPRFDKVQGRPVDHRRLAELASHYQLEVRAEHISDTVNVRADHLSRQLEQVWSLNLRLKSRTFRSLVRGAHAPSVDFCCDVFRAKRPGCLHRRHLSKAPDPALPHPRWFQRTRPGLNAPDLDLPHQTLPYRTRFGPHLPSG
jgi:hypothetical protein